MMIAKARKAKAWEKMRARLGLGVLRARLGLGVFGDTVFDLYGLADACAGWPDVDLWAGSTIREWWNEEKDGEALQEVIRRVGLAVPVHPLDTAEEIRATVSYSDFIRAAEAHVREVGDY